MHLEIYAANLIHGGAVVTAASLLDGIAMIIKDKDFDWIGRLDLVISPQVLGNLTNQSLFSTAAKVHLTVRHDSPHNAITMRSTSEVDVRFAIFGPEYVRSRARVNVVGFADGTLIPSWNPDIPSARNSRSLGKVTRTAIKKLVLGRYDAYVVQTDGMANALIERFRGRPIAVIPNLLAPPFLHHQYRSAYVLPERLPGEARFFYPAMGYPHKNHQILADVSHQYQRRFRERLTFITTLTPAEFSKVVPLGCNDILNIGPVPAAALPSLYDQSDGLFFPSLNETFSSAPLEAAYMRKPVVVSNKPFARETLGDQASYFDPQDSVDAAIQTRIVFEQVRRKSYELEQKLDRAKRWADSHANPSRSGSQLLEFLRSVALQ